MDATRLCNRCLTPDRVLSDFSQETHRQGGCGVVKGYGRRICELPCPRTLLNVGTVSRLLSSCCRAHLTSSLLAYRSRSYTYRSFPHALDGEQESLHSDVPISATEDCNETAKALREYASESLGEKASTIEDEQELHLLDVSNSAKEDPCGNYEDTKSFKGTVEQVMEKEITDDNSDRERVLSCAPSSETGSFLQCPDFFHEDKGMDTCDEAENAEQNSPGALSPEKEDFLHHHACNGEAEALGKDASESVMEKGKVMDTNSTLEPGYVGLFVWLLGMDNRAEDRARAVQALWSHSKGGRNCVDEIMQFPGCLTLLISLLTSEILTSVEAAAGLLQNISSINVYRSAIADAGAIEEITGILTRRKIPSEIREGLACILWNLSVEERNRRKIASIELLPVLVVMLDSVKDSEIEAAAGVIANLSLSDCHHSILTEAGVIPKMANIIKDVKSSKVARQEARNTLVELARNSLFRLAILEEGLIPVPLIGASAYQSFKPLLDKVSTLSNDVKLEPSSNLKSPFGANKLLLGLHVDNGFEIDDNTRLALESRVRQQFLARIGVMEKDGTSKANHGKSNMSKITLMPWWDGISRLVLILGLEDASVAKLAAQTITDIAITEEIRNDIHKSGAIGHLVRLLGSGDEEATESAASALERLASSYKIRRSIDAHGAVPALVSVLNASDASPTVKEKVVAALACLSQTGEEMVAMIQSGAAPGLKYILDSTCSETDARKEACDILEEVAGKSDPRDKIVAANGVPSLIHILESGSPYQKEKAACVLENLASQEQHAECIVEAGVESALKASLNTGLAMEDLITEASYIGDAHAIVEKEEILSSLTAVTRLLDKLLRFEKIRNSVNCKELAIILANILRSGVPLYVKDWVSACLLKLERLAGIPSEVGIPTDTEVTIHDTIPRLIMEIGSSSSLAVQEAAVEQLRDFISHGVPDYIATIVGTGGIFPLVKLLDQGTLRAKIAALAILYNISMDEENHPAILAAGAAPYLGRFVRSEMPEWKLALYLLRSLPT